MKDWIIARWAAVRAFFTRPKVIEYAVVTCPPGFGPKIMIGLERIGGTKHGKTKTIFT